LTTQHKTPNVSRVCGWALCARHNAQPELSATQKAQKTPIVLCRQLCEVLCRELSHYATPTKQ